MKAPKEIWAYVCEIDNDGEPIWCLAADIDHIPEDHDGEQIARYGLTGIGKFEITRQVTVKRK